MGKWYHPVLEARADKNLISHVINLRFPCTITLALFFPSCQTYHRTAPVATSYCQIASTIAELQNLGFKLFTLEYVLDTVPFH